MISKAGLTNNKTTATPLESNAKFTHLDDTLLNDVTLYWKLIGSLIYLIVPTLHMLFIWLVDFYQLCTLSAVQLCSAFSICINNTLFHSLHFYAHISCSLCTYLEVHWVGDPTDRHFTTGYCVFFGRFS